MAERDWDVVFGRCGACRKFERDFPAEVGTVYGHCGRKPRTGSIQSSDFKCDVYDPIAEMAPEKTVEKPAATYRKPMDVFADPETLLATVTASPTRRHSKAPTKVVRRRPPREGRDHEPVDLGGDEMDRGALRELIREAIEDSMGIGEVDLLDRFDGGSVEIHPGVEGTQSKSIPIDTLFRKIVMIRDNLRVLEQKINQNKKLSDADRIQLQQYVTRCYGSLTTFNVLFKNRDDGFRGAGS